MNTKLQSNFPLHNEIIKNLELYFNKNIKLNDIYFIYNLEKYQIQYNVLYTLITSGNNENRKKVSILRTVQVTVRKIIETMFPIKLKSNTSAQLVPKYKKIFSVLLSFGDSARGMFPSHQTIIGNDLLNLRLDSEQYYYTTDDYSIPLSERNYITIPCTEEEYFMYSLKEKNAVELNVYEEADSLRKKVNAKYQTLGNTILEFAGAKEYEAYKVQEELKEIYINLFNLDYKDLNEFHESLRNIV